MTRRAADPLDGYVDGTPYVLAAQPEAAPAWLDHIALQAGYAPPRSRPDAPFTYCDLGCGRGLTVTSLAASAPNGTYLGLDGLAAHTDEARARAKSLGLSNLSFRRDTFRNALSKDYGPFDYIVCHGVYAWVSSENRQALVDFIARFLKPGGLAYLGYNALPGWNRELPLQRLVLEAARVRPKASPAGQFKGGATLIAEMRAAQALNFHNDPRVEQFLNRTVQQPSSYLVHEYLNENWAPVYGADVESTMADAGLTYVGSLRALENREDFFLRKSQRALLDTITDRMLRSLIRDFLIDQHFRMDLFVNGAKRLRGSTARRRRLDSMLAPAGPVSSMTFSLRTQAGTLSFENAAAKAITAALASGPKTLRAISASCGDDITDADLLNTVDALLASNQCQPADPASPAAPVNRVNRLVRRWALDPQAFPVQVSVYGMLVNATRLQLLLLGRTGSQKFLEAELLAHLAGRNLDRSFLLSSAEDRKRPATALRQAIRNFVRDERPFYLDLGIESPQGPDLR